MTGPARSARSALIVNAYSFRNAGDAAIMLSTAMLLREAGFDRVAISSRYTEDAGDYARWGIEVIGPLVPFATASHGGRIRALGLSLHTARTLVPVLAPAAASRSPRFRSAVTRLAPAAAAVAGFDLTVVAGGGYLYTARRWIDLSLAHTCLTMLVARRLAPWVVSMPQSIGPINRTLDRVAVELAFGGLTAFVREALSLSASRRRPHLRRVVVVPDVVFLGLPQPCATARADRTVPVRSGGCGRAAAAGTALPVARVVVMRWSWSTSVDGSAQDRYLRDMAAVCDLLGARGYRVVLGGHSQVPEHDQDDIEVCRAVADRALTEVAVDPDCDVAHLDEEYRDAAVVVGTRLHACIMAISCGTPAVALAYQEKAIGVADGLDGVLPVFRVDDVDPLAIVRAVESSSRPATVVAATRAAAAIRRVYLPLLAPR